jgi:hypothetical protein
MPGRRLRLRRATCAATVVLASLATLPPSAGADVRHCKSSDLRYPFEPGGPKTFGVFKLRITGGSCATAHRVAKAWMKEFEANLDDGRVELPRTVAGFTFTRLPVRAAQTYRLRGRKQSKTMRFDYVVPNG